MYISDTTQFLYILFIFLLNFKGNTKRKSMEEFLKDKRDLTELLHKITIVNGKVESQRFQERWFKNHGHSEIWDKYFTILQDKPLLAKILGFLEIVKSYHAYNFTGICEVCGKNTKFVSLGRGFSRNCSQECTTNFKSKNYIEKTGYDHQMKNPDVLKKIHETNDEIYGGWPTQNSVVKDKIISTVKERYGDEYVNVFQVPIFKEKIKTSMFSRHGGFSMQSPTLSKRILETKLMIGEDGLNSYQRRSIELLKEDEDGLNSYQRMTLRMLNDIDENGFNAYDRGCLKKLNDIDENGLNTYDRIHLFRLNNIDERGLNSYDRSAIKIRKTNEAAGRWVPDYKLDDFSLYCRKVNRITVKQPIETLENFDLRGHANKTGSYHLDHKFSKFMGFQNNIPPYIIGNIINLEMIEARNIVKSRKCSLELEELFERFFNQ